MRFIDRYFYQPNLIQKVLIFILLPISFIYLIASILRRRCSKKVHFNVPIISLGNLVLGGSGKTPMIIALAREYEAVTVISRGYKRDSKGLVIVSINGNIIAGLKDSGDEAYMMARELRNASVIVSKNREEGINKALSLGAKIIFLDDGFRFNFNKLNIILKPIIKPYFRLTIPSGMYRENPFYFNKNDVVIEEGHDFKREVNIINETKRMLLVSAIANPSRLYTFLRQLGVNIVGEIILSDHSNFNFDDIRLNFINTNAASILTTQKDLVKLENLGLPVSLMHLNITFLPTIKTINSTKTLQEVVKEYIYQHN